MWPFKSLSKSKDKYYSFDDDIWLWLTKNKCLLNLHIIFWDKRLHMDTYVLGGVTTGIMIWMLNKCKWQYFWWHINHTSPVHGLITCICHSVFWHFRIKMLNMRSSLLCIHYIGKTCRCLLQSEVKTSLNSPRNISSVDTLLDTLTHLTTHWAM